MPETTPLIKAALNLRGGAGFDVYRSFCFGNHFPLKWAEENLQICCGLGGLIPTIYSFSKKSMLYVAEQQNSHLTVYVKKKL